MRSGLALELGAHGIGRAHGCFQQTAPAPGGSSLLYNILSLMALEGSPCSGLSCFPRAQVGGTMHRLCKRAILLWWSPPVSGFSERDLRLHSGLQGRVHSPMCSLTCTSWPGVLCPWRKAGVQAKSRGGWTRDLGMPHVTGVFYQPQPFTSLRLSLCIEKSGICGSSYHLHQESPCLTTTSQRPSARLIPVSYPSMHLTTSGNVSQRNRAEGLIA